jgi:membrane protease YdiL (CAAX protease family)
LKNALLRGEYLALFFGLPTLYYILRLNNANPPLIPCIIGFSIGCLTLLLTDKSFNRRQLWANGFRWTQGFRVGLLFLVGVVTIGAAVWLFTPEQFLDFPRENTRVWLIVMLLYPLFSVYPQEVVFRPFIFHRYRGVFTTETGTILASASAFAWSHILFGQWISVALTFAGGLLFAYTYNRTRSTLLVSIEHALYGCFVFTVGLGHLFYAGAPLPS